MKRQPIICIILLILLLSSLMPVISSNIIIFEDTSQIYYESPIVSIEYPEDNTTFYISQNISINGYAFDDIGIVEFGYTIIWNTGYFTEINPINSTTYYEFDLPVMIYKGQNEITVHAIDNEGNWGNMTITIYFQNDNRILYVDDDGDADFTRIQDAVNNARDGDTVFVYNGTYNDYFSENNACVRIDKNIRLIGENKYNTIINGNGVHRVIIIWSEVTSISGFTIQHGKDKKDRDWILGIDIQYHESDDIKIFDNIITNNSYGIFTHQSSSNIHIYNNIIIRNCYGIFCEFDYSQLNIYNNTIKDNEYGIFSHNSKIYITNNLISNNTIGISDGGSSSNYSIFQNEISNNKIGIRLDTSITTIKHNNLINNDKQVEVTMDFLMIAFSTYLIYRQDWISNYWDDWTTENPRPIKGRANIYILILRIHPKLTTPIKIAILPYFEYDENPAQDPYDI
ncbi:nitrous oxide reductase family maturation protein NosD [Thermoplasmatota archaeon]